jgi:hypothetical protein
LWHKLDLRAKINVLAADKQADDIYWKQPWWTGLFPPWIPGTRAALFHREQQVTKGIPAYIWDATLMPAMKAGTPHTTIQGGYGPFTNPGMKLLAIH